MSGLIAVLVVGSLVLLNARSVAANEHGRVFNFKATLSGDQFDPPVATDATAIFTITGTDPIGRWRLIVTDIGPATAAHLHSPRFVGSADGIALFSSDGTADFTQVGDFIQIAGAFAFNSAPGVPVPAGAVGTSGVLDTIDRGEMYVEVHTLAHPGGEILGLTQPVAPAVASTGNAGLSRSGNRLGLMLLTAAAAAVVLAGARLATARR